MLRTFFGSLLVAWSFLVIPANLGIPGYEADLLFGYFILAFGSILIVSGVARLLKESKDQAAPTPPAPSSTAPARPRSGPRPAGSSAASAAVRIAGGIASGVVTGLITGAIQRGFGI